MIFDRIENSDFYENLGEKWKKVFAFLKSYKGQKLADRTEIDGENIYAIVQQEYATREENENAWESHQKYADVQYIFEGEELFGIAQSKNLKLLTNYDEEKDVQFYKGTKSENFLSVSSGEFLILFPQDAHLPACHPKKGARLNKRIVVKVKL